VVWLRRMRTPECGPGLPALIALGPIRVIPRLNDRAVKVDGPVLAFALVLRLRQVDFRTGAIAANIKYICWSF